MKKIVLNKKTLRVLTPAEEALISGGTDSSFGSLEPGIFGGGGGGGGGDFGGGGGVDFGGGGAAVPKGTFDTECRCPSYGTHCAATQRIDDRKCKVQGD
ncbi:hypothetical protein [Duganella violaceipulchra]|uniref:Uncharacterized protein n=1 Tax=Duganella violaceipulchra TaxID=2849652 RepID=A0AA41L6W2_9BURK|nr:hypothetical protein [Duganella violaceicalia]MBV6320620.1 hypothetical protein [Duganella violaceicalia]MCP2008671.1 hypothetical protein [Duganella violaceicalia]